MSEGKVFFWKKKYEKLGINEIDNDHLEQLSKKKLEDSKRELEKIKQRRTEREREREERLKELEQQQREKEQQYFNEWESQEDSFHLKQAKLRCRLRIKEGRAKPIDLLARYVDSFADRGDDEKDEELEADEAYLLPGRLAEPYLCLNGLRLNDLEDLQEDIRVYQKIDSQSNLDFWRDIRTIVEDEISKLKKYQRESVERREGINPAVANQVLGIFENKTAEQLQKLQVHFENKLKQPGVDIAYWETLRSKLRAHLARSRLKEQHERNLKKKLGANVKIENIVDEESKPEIAAAEQPEPISQAIESRHPFRDEAELLLQSCVRAYEDGRYSPVLLSHEMHDKLNVIDPAADHRELQMKRKQVLNSQHRPQPAASAQSEGASKEELAFERAAKQGMDDDERVFRNEVVIKQSLPSWADKYKPRKPRYFNRVHTGFEWNKYNQTHYDVDNPPPKVVQGYKFNIFYPDLIDKSNTPTYKFEPCPESKDFKIIRFIAGPPYEDIAFKIVNREWNNSYRSGFRNQFQNNILQLWFHFKRMKYRR